MELLRIAIGGAHPAKVVQVKRWPWEHLAAMLTKQPPVHADKAARGWYCPVEFDPLYRDSENFVARYAITFDFDHTDFLSWELAKAKVLECWGDLAFCMYTTASHTPGNPRFRVVMPLSRPAGYDEFQAVARKVATDIGIELVARESFVPAQMMYLPTVQPGREAEFASYINEGNLLDVDEELAGYENWTDRTQWPTRADGDAVHSIEGLVKPDEKPGLVGDWCRALSVEDCIERFKLPYVKVR